MADASVMQQLSAETRTRLRSTQILTSLATVVSELMQNAIDAGASQIDIGVDCGEWSCWVVDNGTGMTKESLNKLGREAENGRYNSSKVYTTATLDTVSTFGFRGEALASMVDLCCMEISSRTARSRESWTVIVKAGKCLYTGPSIRWRRTSPGTVVSIRDAFFCLPVRRQTHPTRNRTIELIRQDVEAYALVFSDISFSVQDTNKTIVKIPKTCSTLAAFRHLFGRAFTECVEPVSASSGDLRIEGFISLVGAHTKSYQFLYINRHPIRQCDLHRLIDSRFVASSFAKHAYDDSGETSSRPAVRRSTRKAEKKPVYVLDLIIPAHHIDNCLEPSKSTIDLDNKNIVTRFLSATIQSFLVRHKFAADRPSVQVADGTNPRKKRKWVSQNPIYKLDEGVVEVARNDLSAAIDNHAGDSYPESLALPSGPSQTNPVGRTLQLSSKKGDNEPPNWLQQALQANDAYALQQPKIPSVNQTTAYQNFGPHHNCHTGFLTNRVTMGRRQLGPSSLTASQTRFHKDDLRKVRIISQVDCKFIACVVALERDKDDETCQDELAAAGKTLILIDQHAADERIRVERFLKSICRGFLSHQQGDGGVEIRQLSPPVPVLLARHEASRLSQSLDFQSAFESWGFRFSGLEEIRLKLEANLQFDGGYIQVFVSAIPEIVSEKLLSGREMQELVQGYIGALESREPEPCDSSTQRDLGNEENLDDETRWLKALRWCPRALLDLINSMACRGAIMFNDPLTTEQCERLVKQLSATVFPFQCAHGRPSLVPLICLGGGPAESGLEWEKVAAL